MVNYLTIFVQKVSGSIFLVSHFQHNGEKGIEIAQTHLEKVFHFSILKDVQKACLPFEGNADQDAKWILEGAAQRDDDTKEASKK